MKTPHVTQCRPRGGASARHRAASPVDTYSRIAAGPSPLVRWALGLLAITARLRPAAACEGLNPWHAGWVAPPAAWPSTITYGEVLAWLVRGDGGPSCVMPSGFYDSDAATFSETTFVCNATQGVAFCSSNTDFSYLGAVCTPYDVRDTILPATLTLQPVNNCAVQRNIDCIILLDAAAPQVSSMEDSLTQVIAPHCAGFNPQSAGWAGPASGWPSPTSAAEIMTLATGCTQGPACGSRFSFSMQAFTCADAVGLLVGQRDLAPALDQAQRACSAAWQLVDNPPTGPLVPYSEPQIDKVFDVGLFFTPAGSGSVGAGLLAAAQRTLTVQQQQRAAAKLRRAAICSGAATSAVALGLYAVQRGSIATKVKVGLVMGYLGGAQALAAAAIALNQPSVGTIGQVVGTTVLGATGTVYLSVCGVLLWRNLRPLYATLANEGWRARRR